MHKFKERHDGDVKPRWIKIRNRYVQRSENKGIWCRKDAKDAMEMRFEI
jgi:hypothetical protein